MCASWRWQACGRLALSPPVWTKAATATTVVTPTVTRRRRLYASSGMQLAQWLRTCQPRSLTTSPWPSLQPTRTQWVSSALLKPRRRAGAWTASVSLWTSCLPSPRRRWLGGRQLWPAALHRYLQLRRRTRCCCNHHRRRLWRGLPRGRNVATPRTAATTATATELCPWPATWLSRRSSSRLSTLLPSEWSATSLRRHGSNNNKNSSSSSKQAVTTLPPGVCVAESCRSLGLGGCLC